MKIIASMRKSSIRNQMMAMFLIVILPMFAASVYLLVNMRTTVKDAALSSAMNDADSVKYRITDFIGAAEMSVNELTRDTGVKDFLALPHEDNDEYYSFYSSFSLSGFSASAPQIKNMLVFVPQKDFVFGSGFMYADSDIKSTRWYKAAVGSPSSVFWDVIKYPGDGEYYLGCFKAITYNSKVTGVACAVISDVWLGRIVPNEPVITIISVGKGDVFFSNTGIVAKGDTVSPVIDFSASSIQKTYDYGFFGTRGYSVLDNFYSGNSFQIILLLPSAYVNYELNRLSLLYGGYCALMIVLSILIIILFSSMFSRRIRLLSNKMHLVAKGNFDVDISDEGNDEISDLYSDLNRMIGDMQRLIKESYRARIEREAFKFNQMEAEFKALASQINPHFLYNTLETIRMKAYVNNDRETADLVKKLGKFMRRCLEFKDAEVTLRSELEFTGSYLELQAARFGDRISYNIYSEIQRDWLILPLIIQPIVENAFVHGIESSKANGRIDIKVYYSGEYVFVDVRDNGQGMTPEKLRELERKLEISDTSSGKSIGLTNVHKRIRLYYGSKYGMSVQSVQGKGTTIRLKLPREHTPKQPPVPETQREAGSRKQE
ncbi:MAG: sensor histidine kinase [Ruminococcus sp.]|nr:sensor histidine kinase [Ruminococcus sp.]